jgi:hypothetical protein
MKKQRYRMRNRQSSALQGSDPCTKLTGEKGLTNDASCFKGSSVVVVSTAASSAVSGVQQRVGSVLVDRGFLEGVEGTKGWMAREFSVSRMGADEERRYARAVMGASKRVTISGT